MLEEIEASDGGKGVSLQIVQDECSWCPLTTVAEKQSEQASIEYWGKGEQMRLNKNWDEALEHFVQGAVCNPRSHACWMSLSEVS